MIKTIILLIYLSIAKITSFVSIHILQASELTHIHFQLKYAVMTWFQKYYNKMHNGFISIDVGKLGWH
jgi:hypothetical protein